MCSATVDGITSAEVESRWSEMEWSGLEWYGCLKGKSNNIRIWNDSPSLLHHRFQFYLITRKLRHRYGRICMWQGKIEISLIRHLDNANEVDGCAPLLLPFLHLIYIYIYVYANGREKKNKQKTYFSLLLQFPIVWSLLKRVFDLGSAQVVDKQLETERQRKIKRQWKKKIFIKMLHRLPSIKQKKKTENHFPTFLLPLLLLLLPYTFNSFSAFVLSYSNHNNNRKTI